MNTGSKRGSNGGRCARAGIVGSERAPLRGPFGLSDGRNSVANREKGGAVRGRSGKSRLAGLRADTHHPQASSSAARAISFCYRALLGHSAPRRPWPGPTRSTSNPETSGRLAASPQLILSPRLLLSLRLRRIRGLPPSRNLDHQDLTPFHDPRFQLRDLAGGQRRWRRGSASSPAPRRPHGVNAGCRRDRPGRHGLAVRAGSCTAIRRRAAAHPPGAGARCSRPHAR